MAAVRGRGGPAPVQGQVTTRSLEQTLHVSICNVNHTYLCSELAVVKPLFNVQGPSTVRRGDVLTPELSGFPAVLYLAIAGLFYKCFNETVRGYSLCLFISISE